MTPTQSVRSSRGNSDLIHEHVLIRIHSNWGPPMTYATNLGRNDISRLLHSHGAKNLELAAGRAALQGKVETVHMLYDMAGRPSLEKLTLAGPAYTLSVEGTAVLFTLGARIVGPDGVDRNTIEHLLGTDSRNPPAKHRSPGLAITHYDAWAGCRIAITPANRTVTRGKRCCLRRRGSASIRASTGAWNSLMAAGPATRCRVSTRQDTSKAASTPSRRRRATQPLQPGHDDRRSGDSPGAAGHGDDGCRRYGELCRDGDEHHEHRGDLVGLAVAGSISQGTFIAGPTAGTFTVIATSVDDPSAFATKT